MSELEKRKKLLAAQSDVYRQLLKLEIHNLNICSIRAKQQMESFTFSPLMLMSMPMVGALFGRKRRFTWKRLGALAFLGWNAYKRFRPFFGGKLFSKLAASETTAAEEYLEKKI